MWNCSVYLLVPNLLVIYLCDIQRGISFREYIRNQYVISSPNAHIVLCLFFIYFLFLFLPFPFQSVIKLNICLCFVFSESKVCACAEHLLLTDLSVRLGNNVYQQQIRSNKSNLATDDEDSFSFFVAPKIKWTNVTDYKGNVCITFETPYPLIGNCLWWNGKVLMVVHQLTEFVRGIYFEQI